jgi:integrase/recombinase XerD
MASSWQLTRDMFLSIDEVEQLRQHVRSTLANAKGRARMSAEIDRLVIEGLLFSGLRTTEFCRLRVADTAIGRGESVFVISGMKGRDRTVYVPAEVSDLVRRFVQETRTALLPPNVDPNDVSQPLVFGEHRNPLERTGLYRRVVRVLTAAGLGQRASVQLLRHTYGYLAYLRSGGNLLFVQRQLGHAHPIVTSVYAQFVDESYASLAARVFLDTQTYNDFNHDKEIRDDDRTGCLSKGARDSV